MRVLTLILIVCGAGCNDDNDPLDGGAPDADTTSPDSGDTSLDGRPDSDIQLDADEVSIDASDDDADVDHGDVGGLSDPLATPRAVALYRALRTIEESESFLFGQQHTSWSSKAEFLSDGEWEPWRPRFAGAEEWEIFRSDLEITTDESAEIVGSRRAAVHGFSIMTAMRLSEANRERYAQTVVAAYNDGAAITMHWPSDNPAVLADPVAYPIDPDDKHLNGSNNDPRGDPLTTLAEGSATDPSSLWTDSWALWLREAKRFLLRIRDLNGGEELPVLLRPFHEMLGDAHWWSIGNYPSESGWCGGTNPYVELFRRTVDALRRDETFIEDEHERTLPGLHGLVIVWAPGQPHIHPEPGFRCLYPGADWVDVIGLDIYRSRPEEFETELIANVEMVADLADEEDSVMAIAEFGHLNGLGAEEGDPDLTGWYLERFLRPLREANLTRRIAYAATWENLPGTGVGDGKWWVPLLSFHDMSASGAERRYLFNDPMYGFRAFVNADETLFLGEVPLYE